MTGYFAFPHGPPPIFPRRPFQPTENCALPSPDTFKLQDEIEAQKRLKEEAWEARCHMDQQRRRKRLECEEAEARKSELEWVRFGGVLRHPDGQRDMVRTEQYRAEIRLQDEEKRILGRWISYDNRWRALTASSDSVSWASIPWPVLSPPKTVEDLTSDAIADFIFAPLRVRGAISTKREKIRSSLLRWHPDKLSSVLTRVVDEEQSIVREAVNTVFISLRALQDSGKDGVS